MRPSRDLDAMIADAVMGFTCGLDHQYLATFGDVKEWSQVPNYSGQVGPAFEALRQLQYKKVLSVQISIGMRSTLVTLNDDYGKIVGDGFSDEENHTAHAICLACLKVYGINVE